MSETLPFFPFNLNKVRLPFNKEWLKQPQHQTIQDTWSKLNEMLRNHGYNENVVNYQIQSAEMILNYWLAKIKIGIPDGIINKLIFAEKDKYEKTVIQFLPDSTDPSTVKVGLTVFATDRDNYLIKDELLSNLSFSITGEPQFQNVNVTTYFDSNSESYKALLKRNRLISIQKTTSSSGRYKDAGRITMQKTEILDFSAEDWRIY